jgi:hypothetical protein
MRRRYATILAVVTGVMVVILAAVFALIQSR